MYVQFERIHPCDPMCSGTDFTTDRKTSKFSDNPHEIYKNKLRFFHEFNTSINWDMGTVARLYTQPILSREILTDMGVKTT
jgi:hypothetical protein